MRNLLTRVALTVFATTAFIVIALMLVINYQVSENFYSYLGMSSMHGMMMNHGNMAAMMGIPERHFMASLRNSLLFASVLILIIGGVVSYYLARSIAVPVINLNRAVNAVADGNLNATVVVDRKDEVGQLADAFNTMTEKLKSNTILRQRFLAGIAHELRTPLTVLKANLEGIADGVIAPDQEQIHSLTEEVDQLTKLVGDLRDLSMLEAGQAIPNYKEVDLVSLLQQITQKIRPLASEKNLFLTLTLAEYLPKVWADFAMLQQMVYNLLMNAIRYTAAGGITVTAENSKNAVFIKVIDTGIGIADEDVAHVFDYFYRVDPARAKQSGGTGLGLALVRQMILAHGGQVYASSKLGQGSIFTLELPLNLHQKYTVSP